MDRIIGYALAVPAWATSLLLFPPTAAVAVATSLAFRGWGGADAFFHAAADAYDDQLERAARRQAELEGPLELDEDPPRWQHRDLEDLERSIGIERTPA